MKKKRARQGDLAAHADLSRVRRPPGSRWSDSLPPGQSGTIQSPMHRAIRKLPMRSCPSLACGPATNLRSAAARKMVGVGERSAIFSLRPPPLAVCQMAGDKRRDKGAAMAELADALTKRPVRRRHSARLRRSSGLAARRAPFPSGRSAG